MSIPERTQIFDEILIILDTWIEEPEAIDGVSENTGLITDLGLDSIGILQLILGLEKTFNISIQNHELDSEVLSQMGNLVTLVGNKISENN